MDLTWQLKNGVYKYFSGFSGAREVYISTSPAPESVYKYFSGARKMFLDISQASPAPEKCIVLRC